MILQRVKLILSDFLQIKAAACSRINIKNVFSILDLKMILLSFDQKISEQNYLKFAAGFV